MCNLFYIGKALVPEFSSNSIQIPEKIVSKEAKVSQTILPVSTSTPATPISSSAPQNVTTEQAVKELEELALQLKMRRPIFQIVKQPKSKIGKRFEFVVHLNGKTYRAPAGKAVHCIRDIAKLKVALYCKQVLSVRKLRINR